MSIAENIAKVRERIAIAARRAMRDPDATTLMAVTKTVPVERIREAYAAGIRVFGENRVQEFGEKAYALRDLPDAAWHMIGHLQTNKAARAAELFPAVDSLDSLKLAEKLNAAARGLNKKIPVLIEINIAGETAKSGVAGDSSELGQMLDAAPQLANLEFCGLMAVPPFADDPEQTRPYFRRLRELRDQIAGRKLAAIRMDVLSMGMSHDFEIAVEEASTCVRVGTAIFGERSKT
ncbi:MAG TPA: YggS family pyridoxal phosphate-dependent enzyme [Terriglobales bacterium]|nr:YggS family pyridoxal phosphate-dependent enzyme [Terriglobales bacterium]